MSRGTIGALEEMDVVEPIDDAGDVIEVLHRRFAILAAIGIDHVDGGAGGAEIDPLAPGLEVVAGILAVQGKMPARLGDGVLDQSAGKGQPAIGVEDRAGRGHGLDAGRNGVGEADLLQHIQGGVMDVQHLALAQRQVPAAGHPRPDRTIGRRQRRGSGSPPRLAAAAPRCLGVGDRHGVTPHPWAPGKIRSAQSRLRAVPGRDNPGEGQVKGLFGSK